MATNRHVKDERGIAMVEFALVLPLLMLVLVGIFEFGRAFNYWIDATHLANEGARWAAVNRAPTPPSPGPCSAGVTNANRLQRYVASQAATGEMRDGLVADVTFSRAGGAYTSSTTGLLIGDSVRVKVTKTTSFPLVGGMLRILGGSGFGTITYRGTSTMRLDQLPTTYAGGTTGTPCT